MTKAGKSGSAEFTKLVKEIAAHNQLLGLAKGKIAGLQTQYQQTGRAGSQAFKQIATTTAGGGVAAVDFTKKMRLQQLAVSQAAFGLQDFVQVMSQPGLGFIPAMRAASNNVQQTLFLLGGMKGALIGIGAGIAVAALPALAGAFGLVGEKTKEATDQLKEFQRAIERLKVAQRSREAPEAAKIEAQEVPLLKLREEKRREVQDARQRIVTAEGKGPGPDEEVGKMADLKRVFFELAPIRAGPAAGKKFREVFNLGDTNVVKAEKKAAQRELGDKLLELGQIDKQLAKQRAFRQQQKVEAIFGRFDKHNKAFGKATQEQLPRERPPRAGPLIAQAGLLLLGREEAQLQAAQGGVLTGPQQQQFKQQRAVIQDARITAAIRDMADTITSTIREQGQAGFESPKLVQVLDRILQELQNRPAGAPPAQ